MVLDCSIDCVVCAPGFKLEEDETIVIENSWFFHKRWIFMERWKENNLLNILQYEITGNH